MRRNAKRLGVTLVALSILHCSAVYGQCTGDCNGDGQVAINELIRGVNIALDRATTESCPAFDSDGNSAITIAELVAAVGFNLEGCPPEPTAANTGDPTEIPTTAAPATATHTSTQSPTSAPPVCTPPPCSDGALTCPETCPGGCGVVCVPHSPTATETLTPTRTFTLTATQTPTPTSTHTRTPTRTSSSTATNSPTGTYTPTTTNTASPTIPPTSSPTSEPTSSPPPAEPTETPAPPTSTGTPTPTFTITPTPELCGNQIRDDGEECDDQDFGDTSCTSLGFELGGTLLCTGECQLDTIGCLSNQRVSATGQTTSYITGDDGDIRAGAPPRFQDNGDGTITDLNTGLMWEKKDDSAGLHDVENTFDWSGNGGEETIWDWLDDVNAEASTGFAGFNDWRIPNINELLAITDYETEGPSVFEAFHLGCVPRCVRTNCSCTAPAIYWSSTTHQSVATNTAWTVNYQFGRFVPISKVSNQHVRAVRGGLGAPPEGQFRVPATGQTKTFQADKNDGAAGAVAVADDGAIQAGEPAAFVDNGDGTITDLRSGLMWEKKGDSAGLHDVDGTSSWNSGASNWISSVNSEPNPIFGTVGFAGYTDWRTPNVNELRGVLKFGINPGLFRFPVFSQDCTPGCPPTSCSCFTTNVHWTSTTDFSAVGAAYALHWELGTSRTKSNVYSLRAVRGGVPSED